MGADGSPGNLVRQELSQDVKEVPACRQEVKTAGGLGRHGAVRAPGLPFSSGEVCGDSGVRAEGPGRLPGERVSAVANVFALNLFVTNVFVTVEW